MSIDERLDRLLNVDPAPDAPISEEAPAPDLPQEPIQVAGLGKALKGLLSGGKKAAQDAPSAPAGASAIPTPPQPSAAATPAAPTPKLSDPKAPDPVADRAKQIFPPVKEPPPGQTPIEKLITPAKADDIKQKVDIRDATERPATGKPPEELFNFMRTGLPDDANTFIDEAAKAAGVTAPTRVTHAEVLADLQAMGYKAKDLDWITNYADNTEQMRKVAMAREVLVSTAKMTQELAKQLTNAPTPELAAKYHQATVMLGQLSRGVKNIQTDYARALGVMRATPDGDAFALADFVNNIGGLDNVVAHAGKLAKLDMDNLANIKRAADLAEVSIWTKLKNIWVTTWINGMLSSPVTHAKNILGNELFALIQVPERGVASLIGKVRGADVGDRVEMDEAVALLRGMYASQFKALDAFATSFVNNAPVTGSATKMADAGSTISNFGDYLGIGGMLGRAANLYGKAVTLPGRGVMSEDEFFKMQGYFMELYAQASRRSALVYDDAIKAGKTVDEARAAEKAAYVDILDNPPPDINAASWNASKYLTFTDELERGSIGQKFQDLAATNLAARILMPFVRTPINIAAATLERTPFAFAVPSWRSAYAAGGISRDIALARAATGTSLLTVGGFMAASGRITGSGPSEPGQRESLKNSGWQPYSFVFFKDEIDDDTRKLLGTYGRITETNDKVFWSYQGIEPIGGILGAAADYADYARYSDKESDIEQMGYGIAFALSTYTMELPYLQGMAEVVKTMTGGGGGQVTADTVKRMVTQLQKSATSFVIGGSPAGLWSSALAMVERQIDPAASDITVPGGTPWRGVFEAINQYKSRVPGLSASLPPLTNRWGEVVNYGEGALYETVSPIRIKEGKQKEVDRIWLEHDLPRGQPSRKIGWEEHSGMAGIKIELTAEQFNELKFIYGNSGVQEELVRQARDPAFRNLNIRQKQALLMSVDSKYMRAARSELVNNSRFAKELQAKFEDAKFKADTYGIYSDALQ
jgi:hypothetical protein